MKGIFTCKMTDWDCDLAQKQLILIERSVMFYVEDGLKCNIVGLMNCNSLSSVSTIYFLWEFPFRGNVQFKIIPLEWVSILMGSWDLCCKRFFPPCWVFGEPDPGMRNFLSLSLSYTLYPVGNNLNAIFLDRQQASESLKYCVQCVRKY